MSWNVIEMAEVHLKSNKTDVIFFDFVFKPIGIAGMMQKRKGHNKRKFRFA